MTVKRVPRKETLSSGLRYSVHGIGCYFEGINGEALDLDFEFPLAE